MMRRYFLTTVLSVCVLFCTAQSTVSFSERDKTAKERTDKIESFWETYKKPGFSLDEKWNVILKDTVDSPFLVNPQEKNSKEYQKAERSIIKVQNSQGKDFYMTFIKIDDGNFALSYVPATTNKITGEKEYDYQNFIYDNHPFIFVRSIGNSTIYSYSKDFVTIWVGNEYPMLLYFPGTKNTDLWSYHNYQTENDIIHQADNIISQINSQLKKETYDKFLKAHPITYTDAESKLMNAHVYYGSKEYEERENLIKKKNKEKSEEYKKYMEAKRSEKMFAANPDGELKFDMDDLTPGYNEYKIYGFLNPDKNTMYYITPQYDIAQRIYLDDDSNYIDLTVGDMIRDIRKDGKVITIFINDDDYLKYTTYSNFIFDGKLKREDGVFEISETNWGPGNFKAKFTLSQDKERIYDQSYKFNPDGEYCVIPAGTYMEKDNFKNDILRFTKPGDEIVNGRYGGMLYNQNGELTHYFSDNNRLMWKEGDKIIDAMEKEKAAAKKTRSNAAYNALCQKYGKGYVDAAINGKITVGMPIGLIQDLFETQIWHNYDNTYKAYVVLARPALYVDDIGKYSAKKDIFIPVPFKELIVHTRNGKVSSISYY